ncbi:MAG: carotenoid oxygenase family protein, partial [Pseudomonadota bacterium]
MSKQPENPANNSRRDFLGGSLSVAAGLGAASLLGAAAVAQAQPPAGAPGPGAGGPPPAPGAAPAPTMPRLFRAETEIRNCEVEGTIPSDLNGAFYRVGPDAQYPLRAGNIPFDGEGHVGMFRIKNGRVDYKTRFVRNERYMAQDKAGKLLFPMYRNPLMDDPSVKGLSRSTANTHIINHKNMLLCLKEDSPPSAVDLLTLDIVDPVYKFDGQLNSQTFTAHPKIDSRTGNMVAFGYESEGFGSDIVTAFEVTPQGKKVWEA